MKYGLLVKCFLFMALVSFGSTDAFAGHCRKGSDSERIRCLNSEVAYLTAKWKETGDELKMLRAEIPQAVAAAFPKGAILSWYMPAGMPAPEGWALCDGTEGQPNLMGKFLRGGTNIGEQGGAEKHTHKVANDGGRDGRGFAVDKSPSALGNTDEASNLPPYVTVAFICKK